MREILFRGKRFDNGGWVTGGTIIHFLDDGIHTMYMPDMNDKCTTIHEGDTGNIASFEECLMYKVGPGTVGQYTGLTDKNGKEIFEGDILQIIGYGEVIDRCVIGYGIYDSFCGSDGSVGFYLYWLSDKKQERKYSDLGFWVNVREAVCIGNIHDNPELMEVQA